jgi:hypothetical protein
MAQLDFLQRVRDLRRSPAIDRVGIDHGPSQRARRHIGPLRQYQEPRPRPNLDLAFAPRPHAGASARERALAGSRIAREQHLLAWHDDKLRAGDDGGAIFERDGNIA